MSNSLLIENITMSLPRTIELSTFIGNESNNQSNRILKGLNASIIEDKELYHFYKKEQLIFLVTLLIFIIVGNSLVLITLASNKTRKPRMNYFIKHLAYSDLLVGLVSVSVDISWKITLSFNAGNLLCKLVKYTQQLVIYASTYVLVMLGLDRYDAVINPLNFNTRTNRAKHMVFIAWLLSGLLSIPALFLNKIQIKNNLSQCWIELSVYEWRLYFTLVSLSLFFIPTLIIFYCYICIIRTIWFQRQTEQTTATESNNRSSKEIEQFTSKDPFLNGQPKTEHPPSDLLNKDSNKNQTAIIQPELSKLRDRLSLKLNSITQSSMWPDSLTNNKYKDKFKNSAFNDTFNSTSIDKADKIDNAKLPNKRLFNPRSILQKHHSFDQAFDHSSFDRICLNPKLSSIKEQTTRLESISTSKLDQHQQKNNCMRVNSQGIYPKAKIKTLQMTFVIITVFICCWSPYIIWDLLQVYGYIRRSAITNPISTFVQSLAPLNSAANPLIFCFFSSKEVLKTIKLIWGRVLVCISKRKKVEELEQIQNRSLTNTTIRRQNDSTTTTSTCTTKSTSLASKSLSRSKSTEN